MEYTDCQKLTNLFLELKNKANQLGSLRDKLLETGEISIQEQLRDRLKECQKVKKSYESCAHEKIQVSEYQDIIRLEAVVTKVMKERILQDYQFEFETNENGRVTEIKMQPMRRSFLTGFADALPLARYLKELDRIYCPQSDIKEIPSNLGVSRLDCHGSKVNDIDKETMKEFNYLNIANTPVANKVSVRELADEVEEENLNTEIKYKGW